jgi:hypothetical protein
METNLHNMRSLFQQLGLLDSQRDMLAFIAENRLAEGVSIIEAPFWSTAQLAFLTSAIADDADWVHVVDELAIYLECERIAANNETSNIYKKAGMHQVGQGCRC